MGARAPVSPPVTKGEEEERANSQGFAGEGRDMLRGGNEEKPGVRRLLGGLVLSRPVRAPLLSPRHTHVYILSCAVCLKSPPTGGGLSGVWATG